MGGDEEQKTYGARDGPLDHGGLANGPAKRPCKTRWSRSTSLNEAKKFAIRSSNSFVGRIQRQRRLWLWRRQKLAVV